MNIWHRPPFGVLELKGTEEKSGAEAGTGSAGRWQRGGAEPVGCIEVTA